MFPISIVYCMPLLNYTHGHNYTHTNIAPHPQHKNICMCMPDYLRLAAILCVLIEFHKADCARPSSHTHPHHTHKLTYTIRAINPLLTRTHSHDLCGAVTSSCTVNGRTYIYVYICNKRSIYRVPFRQYNVWKLIRFHVSLYSRALASHHRRRRRRRQYRDPV